MFRKRVVIRYQIPEFCRHCNCSTVREETKHMLCFFFIELFTFKQNNAFRCTSCQRKLLRSDLLVAPPVPPPSDIELVDGTVKRINYRKEGKDLVKDVQLNYKNKRPKTNDPILLSSTILAIMHFIAKATPEVNIKESFNYNYIRKHYKDHQETQDEIILEIDSRSLSDAKPTIIEMFLKCKNEFRRNEMDFIISQGISVTERMLLVPKPVEELFKELLEIDGFPQLQLDSTLLEYRARWF